MPSSSSRRSTRAAAPAPAAEAGPRAGLRLVDVAQALGVSRTTVSNAYNRPEKLSAALREEILAKSRELGYFGPDPTARALRRRALSSVGVVFHHDLSYALNDPTSVEFLQGVSTELDRRHLWLQLIPKMGRQLVLEAAFQSTADAIIMHAEIGPEKMDLVRSMPKPMVLVDSRVEGLTSVCTDDRHGAQLAMQHALRQRPDVVVIASFMMAPGDRQMILTRARPPRSAYVGCERGAGYVMAAREAGFPLERLIWMDVDDQFPDSAGARLAQLRPALAGHERVALVAMSDRMALAARQEARRWRGQHLVSVVGFDDIPAAAHAGLTTVRQDSRRKGEIAVQVLLDGGTPPTVPTQLVEREP